MLFKKPYGVSPNIDIFVGDVPFSYRAVLSLKLVLGENKHDMLIIQATGLPPSSLKEFWGKPVKLEMDDGASTLYTFTGYIDEVRPDSQSSSGLVNQSPIQTTDLVCLGASYEMRGDRTRSWANYTLEAIVAKLAGNYQLSSTCVSTNHTYPTLVQSDSDWAFLSQLATSEGLALNCHGTNLHVYDPRQSASRRNSYHIAYGMAASRGDVAEAPGQILTLKANLKVRMRQETAVLTSRGDTFTVRDSGQLTHVKRSHSYSQSSGSAVRNVRSYRQAEYDDTAHLRVTGLAGVVPGGVIKILGYEDGLDGLWYVREVTHRVDSKTYYSDLTVSRNRDDDLAPTNTAVHFVDDRPALRQGKWVASRRVANVYI